MIEGVVGVVLAAHYAAIVALVGQIAGDPGAAEHLPLGKVARLKAPVFNSLLTDCTQGDS